MSYNHKTMIAALLAAFLLVAPARAEDEKPKTADKTTIELAEYFAKTPTSEANPKLVDAFLAIDPATLPKRLQTKTKGKQMEIQTLINLQHTKKAGSLIQPDAACTGKDMVKALSDFNFYTNFGYEEVNEDELKYVMDKTKCSEIDLGCRFSLKIFFTKPKPRKLAFYASDPIMALVAESRKGGGTTHFFGMGLTCLHD